MIKQHSYQTILFWLLTGLIIFIPLYPKFPLLSVSGTYVAIRLEDFLIAGSIAVWILYQLLYKREILKKVSFQAFLLFWFVGLISLLSAVFVTHSVVLHLGFLHWIRRIEFLILFWLAVASITTKQQVKILLWAFILVTCCVLFYGYGQLFLGFKVISTIDKDFSSGIVSSLASTGRVNSTFAGHYDLAIYLSFFLICMTGVFFSVKKRWQQLGILIISLCSFVLLGYTASRISFAATLGGLILVLFLLKKRGMIVGLILASIIMAMAVPQFRERIVATVKVNILKSVEKSYTPTSIPTASEASIAAEKAKQGLPIDIAPGESTNYTELEVGRSASIRLTDEWPRALRALYKNPLLGTGYSSISLATDNDYLRALGETGILGFLAFALIFWMLIRTLFAALKTADRFTKVFVIIGLGIIFDVLITCLFIDALEASKVACILWILLGVLWSQIHSKKLL